MKNKVYNIEQWYKISIQIIRNHSFTEIWFNNFGF